MFSTCYNFHYQSIHWTMYNFYVWQVCSLTCYDCLNVQLHDGSNQVGSLATFINNNQDTDCGLLVNYTNMATKQCPTNDSKTYTCGYVYAHAVVYAHRGKSYCCGRPRILHKGGGTLYIIIYV